VNHVFSIVEAYSSGPVFSTFTGKCVEAERIPVYRYFIVGAEIAPTSFVAFTRRLVSTPGAAAPTSTALAAVNGSRITVTSEQFVGADGSAMTPEVIRYRDEKLNAECRIQTAADGVYRCLPDATAHNWFADARCTTRLVETRDARAPGPTPSYAIVDGGNVFHVGAEYAASGPLFFGSSSGNCVQARNLSERYFTLGAEMAPAEFVAFTSKTR
jgi:hypothetical protein